jgi:hypothetical protein
VCFAQWLICLYTHQINDSPLENCSDVMGCVATLCSRRSGDEIIEFMCLQAAVVGLFIHLVIKPTDNDLSCMTTISLA